MSPLEIEIILHYHCSQTDYRNGDFSAPAVTEAIRYFCSEQFLEPRECGAPRCRILPRGTAYVGALTAVPMPVFLPGKWVMP